MPRPDPHGPADLSPRERVMLALDSVMDPELDESVAAMGFVESVAVEDDAAEIVFRLPTFWCSANFAFLIASDMRCAVERLPSIRTAKVRLVDHFAARKINRGVAEGLGFADVFAGEANAGLDEVRRAFRERAFLGRQERLLRPLVAERGIAAALDLTLADLEALTRHEDQEIGVAATRYLALRRSEVGGDAEDPAFVTLDGAPVTSAGYGAHLRAIRSVRGAAEANAEMCRLYLGARITHPAPGCEPENREDDDA